MWYSPSAKKWWLLLRLAHRSFTYRQECDVKRYMNSLADQEDAAGTVLKASQPFLKSDECERANFSFFLPAIRQNVAIFAKKIVRYCSFLLPLCD